MSWRNDLEIIDHHARTGGVWAGDQISKVNLRKLCQEGYITYTSMGDKYVLTVAGQRAWARWRLTYYLWNAALRVKWRVQELISEARS